VIKAERSRLVVVTEKLGIASPFDCSSQSLLRVVLVQMVLEFELEPGPGCAVLLTLVEHLTDMAGERHKPDQMLPEQPLPLFGAALGENPTRGGQLV
jgi:hypothetical protein